MNYQQNTRGRDLLFNRKALPALLILFTSTYFCQPLVFAQSNDLPLVENQLPPDLEIPDGFPDIRKAPENVQADFRRSIDEMLVDLYQEKQSLETNSPAERVTAKATVFSLFGDYPRAEALLKKAVAIDPEFTMAHYNLACTYALQGKVEEATQSLENALKRNPDKYVKMARHDKDFKKIRNDERFQALLKKYSSISQKQ